MKNKKRIRLLAMATAVTVLTTAIPPQGMAYAAEPMSTQTALAETTVTDGDSQIPSENMKEGVEPELLEESVETASTEGEEESTETASTEALEKSTEPEFLEGNTETASTEGEEESTEPEDLEESTEPETLEEDTELEVLEEDTELEILELEEEEDIKSSGEIPAVGSIVKKNTIDVEKKSSECGQKKETNWKLVWSDEFNSGALDTTKWGYQVGNGSAYGVAGWGNNELEYYTDNNENVSFEDGKLVITAKKNNQHGSEWTSAKLWTLGQEYYDGKTEEPLFEKKYGRIEAKITLPEGTGLWPAFWMMPSDDVYGGWASSGEIDIMEARGCLKDSVDGTIHFGNAAPNNKNRGGQYDANKADSDAARAFDFTGEHEYAIEWLPGQMKWFVDDECYFTTSNWYSTAEGNGDNFTYPAPFDQDFFIMLNLAVGGNYDGGRIDETMTEASMKVDYVRVYDLRDDEKGTVHDYAKDEKTVSSTSSSSGGGLLGGKEIGDNYFTGSLKNAHASVADQDEKATSGDTPNNEGWYLLTGTNGEAAVSGYAEEGAGDSGVARVSVANPGDNSYSVQFSHQLPLTEGYSYKLSFEAKADTPRNITAQLSDYVYTSFDGSWTKYSDLKTAGLTTDWKTFEFTFDMTELSDDYTRLELNLGAGSTGNVYFRNASLAATGKVGVKPDDIVKDPLGNGEHIYNGTFDQGNNKNSADEYTRMRFWSLMGGATGSVTNNRARSLVLSSGTSTDAGIEQKNVQLLANEEYKLTFDASGGSSVTVKVIGSDGAAYKETTVTANGKQEITFDVPETAGVSYGNIQFIIGNTGNSITLDNVSMKRETNRSADWSSMGFYLIDNYDFSKGEEGWNVFNAGSGQTWGWVNNGTASSGKAEDYNLDIRDDGLHLVTSIPQNGVVYSVGIETAPMNITPLVNYKLRIKVKDVELQPKEEATVKDKKTILINMPDGSTATCEITAGNNQEIVIPFQSKSAIEGGTILLQLGANSAREFGNYNFVLEYVDFLVDVENNEKNNIPEDYKNILRPASVVSAGEVSVGMDAVIKHNDDAWVASITTTYVNGEAIDGSLVDTSESGKIIIKSGAIPKNGTYAIRFAAKGYDISGTVNQRVTDNILENGDFSSGMDGWSFWANGAEDNPCAAVSVKNGQAAIDFKWHEGNDWDQQFARKGIVTAASDYLVSFEAYATIDRPILVCAKDGTGEKKVVVDITKEKSTYYVPYKDMAASTHTELAFWTGNVDGRVGNEENPHTIYIDNVRMWRATEEEFEELVPPTISNAKTAYLGKDVVLGYTENKVWEQKAITVKVDGVTAAANKVKVNTEANTITLDKTLFKEAKRYEISVTAEGCNKQILFVNVAASRTNLLPEKWDSVLILTDEGEQGTITTQPHGLTVTFKGTVTSQWNGPEFWSMQAKAGGINTEAGKTYVLSFDAEMTYEDASVDVPRGLVVELGSQATQPTIEIKKGTGHYEYEVTPGASDDYYVLFMPGGAEFDVKPHTLKIRNIKFAEKGAENIKDAEAPTIKTQPKAPQKPYMAGDAAEKLAIEANVPTSGNLSYQWYMYAAKGTGGAVAISGATEASYTPDTSVGGKTGYYCTVTNTDESVTGDTTASIDSDIVEVTVHITNAETPVIESQPSEGQTYTYTVGDEAAPLKIKAIVPYSGNLSKLSYQWYKRGANAAEASAISGATEASYTPDTSVGGKTSYYCTVTNTDESAIENQTTSVNSNIVEITVNEKQGNNPGDGSGSNPGGGNGNNPGDGSGNNPGGGNGNNPGDGSGNNPGGGNGNNPGDGNGNNPGDGNGNNPGGGNGNNPGDGSGTASATGIILNMTSATLAKGKTVTLKATVTPENASTQTFVWTSDKPAVATVDQSGNVKGVGKGTATITVTTADGSLSATCKVTVNIPSTKVKLNTKKVYVVKGKSVNVKAAMTPFDSTDKVIWSTSNKKVATVKNGKITAKKKGTATITVKTTSGKKATLKVYVVTKARKSTDVKLNKKKLSMKKGATYDLVATVKPATSTDIVKWKSSNKKVAAVDAFGTVTAKKKGTATITATTTSGKKYTCKITVK